MSLLATITTDYIQAMREKDATKKAVLPVLKTSLQNEAIKLKRDLTKDEELTLVNRERKQINDSIDQYKEAGRTDLVEKEEAKLLVVESYLPTQLTNEEIVGILDSLKLTKEDNKGKVIGQITKDYKGQVDGKVVSQVVSAYFAELQYNKS